MDKYYSTNEENKTFIEKFNPEKFGFIDLMPYTNVNIGFQVRKKLHEGDKDNITILGIYIPSGTIDKTENTKKPLNISLYYGKKAEGGGVIIRQDPKLNDPIDVFFPDEYYYDISSGEFFKKDKKITADKIFEEVYNEHIKSTRLLKGLLVRSKIRFYRIFLNLIFKYASKFLSFLVKLISGDVYEYGFPDHINKILNPKAEKPKQPEDKSENRVSFLGYKATTECILFYSIIHFIIFSIFYYFDFKPGFLIKIFSNAFLTLIYVMMSLIIIDKVLPQMLKRLIDIFSELSYHFLFKSIKL